MARSQLQSDFSVSRPAPTELPDGADGADGRDVAAPGAPHEASELATRWVMRLTFVLLLAFAVLCAVGPHIPSGE